LVEVNADDFCAVEPRSESEGLTEPSILAGAGYQNPFADHSLSKFVIEAEPIERHCEGHDVP
jgi:hypothetical protein